MKTDFVDTKNQDLSKELAKKEEENNSLKMENNDLLKKVHLLEKIQKEKDYENKISEQKLQKELKDLQDKLHEIEKKQRLEDKKQPKSLPSQQTNKTELQILGEEDINDLEKIQEIGSGGGGKVFKVASKTIHALKEMNATDSFKDFKNFIAEYEIINLLNHPNIIKTHGIFFGNETEAPKILLEYCSNNLDKAIRSKSLSKVQIVFTIYQIVEGMKYVHYQKIIHRDLKPSNILISDDGTIKICDFGISKIMSTEEQTTMTVGAGTQKYMAPEIVDESDYNEKVDVFSFGVLAYFVLNNSDISKIKMSEILRGKKIELPENFTQFAKQLIGSCLLFDAETRPSFEVILNDIENNNFNLVELSHNEINEIKELVQSHKDKIPPY